MAIAKPGRPTVITPEVVSILISSFQNGMGIREACWQSDISHEAYYARLRSDEQFADTMSRAQASCTLKARQVVLDAISGGDVATAKWWLEKKAPQEFGREPKFEQDDTLEKQENPFVKMTDEELDEFTEKFYRILEETSRTGSSRV